MKSAGSCPSRPTLSNPRSVSLRGARSRAQVGRRGSAWDLYGKDDPSEEVEERKRRTIDPSEWALSKAYCSLVGVRSARGACIWKYRPFRRHAGWEAADAWELDPGHLLNTVRRGLFDGSARVDLRGLDTTRLLSLDFDDHNEPPPRPRRLGEDWPMWRKAQKAAAKAWRAARIRALLDAAQSELPFDLVEQTGRGHHTWFLLAEPVPVAVAARIAAALAAKVQLVDGITVESFPKLDADGTGRTCALPLMGSSRGVGPDCVTPEFYRRRPALEAFLALPGHALEEFGIDLEDSIGGLAVAREEPFAESLGHRETTGDQLFGEEFAVECRRLLSGGIDAGDHYDAGRRLAACMFYVSPNLATAEWRFERMLELPQHRSRHCRSDRRHMMRDFRCQARYFLRGVSAGRCHFDGMRSEWIRAFVSRLDGEMAAAA